MKLIHLLDLVLGLAVLLIAVPAARTGEPPKDVGAAEPQTFSVLNAPPAADPEPNREAPSVVQIATADSWQAECVDCPRWFQNLTARSLQLDSASHLHVAYGGDHLYYARHDGTGWQVEMVDQAPGVGGYASLALDGSDRPHISYHDDANGDLKYARYDGVDWQIETVGEVGNWYGHGYASLALDGSDQPHISFYDYTNDNLKYAWHDGTAWQVETVPTDHTGTAGEYSSLALDGSDQPHIAYFDDTNSDLRHAWHDGSNWQFETIDGDANLLGYPSLALDGTDRPHVVYFDGYMAYDFKYAWYDGADWQIQRVDGVGGWYASLVLDKAGRPHVSYYVGGELKYAWRDETAWLVETVSKGDVAAAGWGTALALDPDTGLPHVAYRGRDGDLQHAWRDGAAWRTETLDRGGEVGWATALALDKSDRPHISYYGGGLKYAWHDGAAWQIWTVDNDAHVGSSTSLALDSTGRAHIGYQDWGDGDLKYARHTGTIWQVYKVDRAGYVGDYVSLALDSSDWPHISYFDWSNRNLKYARHDGTAWQIETVLTDTVGSVGMYTALALDKSDRPHISFEAHGDLKYASLVLPTRADGHGGTAWQIETVDDVGVVGRYSSLALDGSDRPHISYYDASNGRLKYAWRDGGGWQIGTVPTDTVGRVGRYTSLALDELDQPHISFYDETNGDLKYAWHDGTAWRVETVSTGSGGDVGRYTALALDGLGRPHVSYYDASTRDLRYARLVPALFLKNQATPGGGLSHGDTLTYTLTFSARRAGPGSSVRLWNPLPANVRYITGSLTPPAIYDPTRRAVAWQGWLPAGTVQVIHFQVVLDLIGPQSIVNTAWLTDTQSGVNISAAVVVNRWQIYLPVTLREE